VRGRDTADPGWHDTRVMPPARKGPIRVVLVDDHRTFSDALRIAVETEKDIAVVGVGGDGSEAVELAKRESPNVMLMDIEMPGIDGIEATRRVKELLPETQVIMLSAHYNDVLLARAVEAGACGYLSKAKAVSNVAEAIRTAWSGEPLLDPKEMRRVFSHIRRKRREDASSRERAERLTSRETEILQLMAQGLSTEDIAARLSLSPHTLRTHVQNILMKLRVHSKLEALAFAIRQGKVSVGAEVGGGAAG
jgi:DNA-binding NarL/FixJ family response regulator